MTDRRPLLRAHLRRRRCRRPSRTRFWRRICGPRRKGRVICLAAGKGAAAMAAAAERHYLDTLELAAGAPRRHRHHAPRLRRADPPHPRGRGRPSRARRGRPEGRRRYAALAARGRAADDLLLVLLTGGGSANWIAPVDGISFAQKQAVNRALLRSGAPIGEMNTVRKHLSRIKGGRLARAGKNAAEIVTLAISDVPHDDPSAIASGPTVPDPTTLADARAHRREVQARHRRCRPPRARRSRQRKLQARRCRLRARAFRADRAAASNRSTPR